MSEQAGSEAIRGVSPNRLLSAPPEYPYATGRVEAVEVATSFGRLGWLLLSGTGGLEWLPDLVGDAEPVLQAWVQETLRAARRDGLDRDAAVAAVGEVYALAEPKRVDDPDAFRAAALPR